MSLQWKLAALILLWQIYSVCGEVHFCSDWDDGLATDFLKVTPIKGPERVVPVVPDPAPRHCPFPGWEAEHFLPHRQSDPFWLTWNALFSFMVNDMSDDPEYPIISLKASNFAYSFNRNQELCKASNIGLWMVEYMGTRTEGKWPLLRSYYSSNIGTPSLACPRPELFEVRVFTKCWIVHSSTSGEMRGYGCDSGDLASTAWSPWSWSRAYSYWINGWELRLPG